jgi:hypothetical protein
MIIMPPTGGWNTKDPLVSMEPQYAIETNNFYSNGRSVDVRKGSQQYAKNIGIAFGSIRSMWEFALQSGTKKLVGITDNGTPFSISAGGTQTNLSGGTKYVPGYSQAVVFMNKLFMKGDDTAPVYYWDGVAGSITAAAFVGPSGDDLALYCPAVYKDRLYFVGDDLSIWYGAPYQITGALEQYDFQSEFTLGGQLYFCGLASQVGVNNNQFFAVISSQGETLIYSGSYPDSDTWEKVGHYYMPPPAGRRAFFYWGTNLVIITLQGVVLLSDVMRAEGDLVFLSENINDQFIEALQGMTPGLRDQFVTGVYYPAGNMLIFNIYFDNGIKEGVQYVMNTITRSWWRWSGLTAYAWSTYDENLYFGTYAGNTGAKIFIADSDYYDEDPENEGAVKTRTIKLRCAYNYFAGTQLEKKFQYCIPYVYQSEGLALTLDINTDYSDTAATSTVTDSTDTAYKLYKPRMGLTGMGKAGSIRIDGTVTTKRMSLQAIDVTWSDGDIV